MPLRFAHQNIPWTSSSSSFSLSPPFLFLCCHAMSPGVVLSPTCHRIHPCVIPEWPFCVILCHSYFIFSQCVPLFCTTIEPFHASLKFPGPPPRSRPLFPSVCLLPPSLFCSPAAHKNSSFLSPEDCSVAWGFTAFLYVFSPFLSLSVSLSLCFGSSTPSLIHSIFSFVCLTHLYPFKASLCFSSPFYKDNILI